MLPALACLTEGLWLSVAAALVARVSWPLMLAGTLVIMSVPATAALATKATRLSTRMSRAIVAVAALASTAALLALQTHTTITRTTGLALIDLLFVVLASWLGIRIGELSLAPDEAMRRAARALVLTFLALLLARLAHQPPAAAGPAVTAVIAAGALLVALARLGESLTMVDRRYGVSGWTWFAGILATVAAILLVAAVLAALTHGAPLAWTLSVILDGLRDVLHALAFIVATAGYALLRALNWLLALFHVHRPSWLQPSQAPHLHTAPLPRLTNQGGGGSVLLRDLAWPLLAALVGGGLLFLLVRAVRRLREGKSPEPQEERESLFSTSDLFGAARLRLSRLVARLPRRHPPPSSPAEAVRREFAVLERSLAALGEARHPSQTVRQYLLRAGAMYKAPSGDQAVSPLPSSGDDTREPLSRGYERARYSQQTLSWQDAADFSSLAQLCLERARTVAERTDAPRQAGEGRWIPDPPE